MAVPGKNTKEESLELLALRNRQLDCFRDQGHKVLGSSGSGSRGPNS